MLKTLKKVFGPKCPKCGSANINKVEKSLLERIQRFSFGILLPVTLLFGRSKPLMVCKECGFSWEKR